MCGRAADCNIYVWRQMEGLIQKASLYKLLSPARCEINFCLHLQLKETLTLFQNGDLEKSTVYISTTFPTSSDPVDQPRRSCWSSSFRVVSMTCDMARVFFQHSSNFWTIVFPQPNKDAKTALPVDGCVVYTKAPSACTSSSVWGSWFKSNRLH